MAYLVTDADEYRPLSCPAKYSIGRATDNDFRPESQSVSKRHAILETAFLYGTEKIEVSIEDLKSTNGTFVGESPLDFEPVVTKKKIPFGTYIRFGFSQKYFRLVDRITDMNAMPDEVDVMQSSFPGARRQDVVMHVTEAPDDFGMSGKGQKYPKDNFLQPSKTKWAAGGDGIEFVDSRFAPCQELLNKAIVSETIIEKMRKLVIHIAPFIPFEDKGCSVQEYLTTVEIFRGMWFELFDLESPFITNNLKQYNLLHYFLHVKSVSELLEIITREIESDDTLLIDLLLASQKCDLQSFIQDIGKAIFLFQKFLIVSIRSEISHSNGEESSSEISSALLTEISSTLIVCCKKIESHETIALSKMVEGCYKRGDKFRDGSELETLLSFLQHVAGSLTQSGLPVSHKEDINSIVRNCTRLFVEANLILTCYYITFLSVALCLQEKLQVYMKSKHGKEANLLLENFRQAALQGDDATLNKLIGELRRQDQQVIGHRNVKLLRCAKIATDQNLKKCINKWRHETMTSKHSDILLFDKVEYNKLKRKRQLLDVWRKCFDKRRRIRKILYRMTRALNSNAFKLKLMAFRSWTKKVASSSKTVPEVIELKLECARLHNELDQIRNSDKIADSLAAEKALNRELHSANIGLRMRVQTLENKLLDMASMAPVEQRDVIYRHLISKDEQLASYEHEIKLLNDEMENIRAKLSFNPPQSLTVERLRQSKKASSSKLVLKEKDEALGIIIHEVRRLREGYSQLKNDKELLMNQIAESKLVTLDIQRANQKLASRIIELERSGAILTELLRQKVGNEGLLEVVEALSKTALDSSALLQPDLTSKLTEHILSATDNVKFYSKNSHVTQGNTEDVDRNKIISNLFAK